MESGKFYLKQTKFIQHQHLDLGHIAKISLGQNHPQYIIHAQKWDNHYAQKWDNHYTQLSESVGGSPTLPERLHSRLLHGTRGARAPPIPDLRDSYNHKSKATY